MSTQAKTFEVVREALYTFFESYHVEDALSCSLDETFESLDGIVLYKYTGSITVSGVVSGCLLVSCSGDFLNEVIKLFLGPRTDIKAEYCVDMVGEMSNTISGYFQKFYDGNFIISAPKFVEMGQLSDINSKIMKPIHTIGFELFGFESKVLVGLS